MSTQIKCEGYEISMVIEQVLKEFGDEVKDHVQDAVKEIATKAKKEVVNAAPVDKGTYKKGITLKDESGLTDGAVYVIYNKGKNRSLGHLLEHGHQSRNQKGGPYGRVEGIPHYAVGQKWANDHFEEILKKHLEK